VPDTPSPALVREFFGDATPDVAFVKGRGCPKCHYIGYCGRALVAELWLPDEQDNLLLMRRAPMDELKVSTARTTITMAQDAHARLKDGRTTLVEMMRILPYGAIVEHRERTMRQGWT
jgi:type IV pilus assembly protein PilB